MEEFVDVLMNRKLTIEEMQEIAQSRGGECLSTEYINAHTKLKWRCTGDHIWGATPANIKRGKWCLKCAGLEKLTIEDMHNLAERKGGKCISTEYINNRNKLRWQCKENHIWGATPSGIKNRGQWCPKCTGVERSTIEEMRKLAEKKGGKCLSEEYVNARTKLKWRCKE
ncbi:MAG: hypothetical protein V3S16_14845, partial [Candidatus Desulfatibia sp.]|uniref:hypothetical protein n=1 Tax=Candidatus Desulfatibia sp. TaxID=3101189 RepID=UPI002F2F7A95